MMSKTIDRIIFMVIGAAILYAIIILFFIPEWNARRIDEIAHIEKVWSGRVQDLREEIAGRDATIDSLRRELTAMERQYRRTRAQAEELASSAESP
jgi:hypothetical protein